MNDSLAQTYILLFTVGFMLLGYKTDSLRKESYSYLAHGSEGSIHDGTEGMVGRSVHGSIRNVCGDCSCHSRPGKETGEAHPGAKM